MNIVLEQALKKESKIHRQPSDQSVREEALDPSKSFIVQAPAGSGKTTLLVERYIRLLGTVNQPEEVIAMTFTRKAAREMRQRVLNELLHHPEKCATALARDRNRGWDILKNPQRLKIITIDSFCAQIVRAMPIQSQMGFEYSPEEDTLHLFQEAVRNTLLRVSDQTEDDEIAKAIADSIARNDNRFENTVELIAKMLNSRDDWVAAIWELCRTSDDEITATAALNELNEIRKHFRESFVEEIFDARNVSLVQAIDEFQPCLKGASLCGSTSIRTATGVALFKNNLITSNNELVTVRGINKNRLEPEFTAKEVKPAYESILKSIDERGLRTAFENLGRLPADPHLQSKQIEVLLADAQTLAITLDELADVFERSGKVDFSEISIAALRALGEEAEPSDLQLELDTKISHLLIDEFQDTSYSQLRLLKRLTSEWEINGGNSFFAVGDPMQSIYQFREAVLKNFTDTFAYGLGDWPLKPLTLTENFRSSPDIVNWVNCKFQTIFGCEDDDIRSEVKFAPSTPYQEFEGQVSCDVYVNSKGSLDAETKAVAERVQEIRSLYPSEETCVLLVQTRNKVQEYLNAFRKLGIGCRGNQIEKLSSVPVVIDLLSIAQALSNINDKVSWAAVCASPLIGLTYAEIESLAANTESGLDFLKREGTSTFDKKAQDRFERFRQAMEVAVMDSHRPIRSRVERAWLQMGGANAYKGDNVLLNAHRLLTRLEQHDNGTLDVDALNDWVEKSHADETNDDADVEVMTIHSAKGLEFDHVLLAKLNAQSRSDDAPFMKVTRTSDDMLVTAKGIVESERDDLHDFVHHLNHVRDLNENKRLFYVATTRAKKTLSLFATVKPTSKQELNSVNSSLLGTTDFPITDSAGSFLDSPGQIHFEELTESDEVQLQMYMPTRIPSDYSLNQEVRLPCYEPTSLAELKDVEEHADPLTLLASHPARMIGNLVHEELHRASAQNYEQLDFKERAEIWRTRAISEGYIALEVNQILEQTETHLRSILADERGRWILSNDHDEAASEMRFTLATADGFQNLVPDRTFIDKEGTRWIVDYKTTAMSENVDQEVAQQLETHRAQVGRYAELFAKIEPEREIRVALYFTSAPRFVEMSLQDDQEST